jgi:hypothetical protein
VEHRLFLRDRHAIESDVHAQEETDARQPLTRRPRFTADQIGSIDLDRPLTRPRYPTRNRGACLGVMGIGEGVKRREGKGAPSTWPEGSDHE